jgi:hypothetical protein
MPRQKMAVNTLLLASFYRRISVRTPRQEQDKTLLPPGVTGGSAGFLRIAGTSCEG